jgi:hypothetical protein
MADAAAGVDGTGVAQRLRRVAEGRFDAMSLDLLREAACEIERLQRTIEDLRAYAEQDACEIERLQNQVADAANPTTAGPASSVGAT